MASYTPNSVTFAKNGCACTETHYCNVWRNVADYVPERPDPELERALLDALRGPRKR